MLAVTGGRVLPVLLLASLLSLVPMVRRMLSLGDFSASADDPAARARAEMCRPLLAPASSAAPEAEAALAANRSSALEAKAAVAANLSLAFVVGLRRCPRRRRQMMEQFCVDVGSGLSPGGVRFDFTIGSFDGFRSDAVAQIKRLVDVRSVSYWKDADPYRLVMSPELDQMKPKDVGCSVSHFLVWRAVAESPAAAALVLEDDARLSHDLLSFHSSLSRAVLNMETLHGRQGWDMLYMDWAQVGSLQADRVLVPESDTDPGLQRVSCFGTTTAYLLSKSGAAKLVRLKEEYFSHFFAVDDFLMSLHGRGCPDAWARPAEYFSGALSMEPFRVLRAFATVKKLFRHGSHRGEVMQLRGATEGC